jgi:hypothetical protein
VTEVDVQQQNLLLFLFYNEGGRRLTLGMMLPKPSEEDVFGALKHCQIFSLLAQHYRRLVQVLDYRRINPLLADWSDEMVFNTVCSLDVIFFTGSKPWKTACPRHGATA